MDLPINLQAPLSSSHHRQMVCVHLISRQRRFSPGVIGSQILVRFLANKILDVATKARISPLLEGDLFQIKTLFVERTPVCDLTTLAGIEFEKPVKGGFRHKL